MAKQRGNQETLDRWAIESAEGEAHFAWGTPGDFQRCVTFMEGKGLSPDVAKGHCANLHHRALGVWPGQEHGKKADGMDTAHGWVPILKQEKQPDGTLIVEGLATDSGIDRDQQIADPAWLSKAMPEWFSSGGNIREQHDGKRAAGVAVEYAPGDVGHRIRAKIVDPVTVAKIEHGVLRGFSFGARNARVTTDKSAAGGRIVDGQIYEVSVVDRPANPRCMLTIAKADDAGELQLVDEPELVEKADENNNPGEEPRFTPSQFADLLKNLGKTPAPEPTTEDAPVEAVKADSAEPIEKRDVDPNVGGGVDRDKLKDSDFVFGDERAFPVVTAGDVTDAVNSWGRYKGKRSFDEFKSKLTALAKRKGFENKLPSKWQDTKKALEAADTLKAVLADNKVDLAKADAFDPGTEAGDADNGSAAIAAIARLIISEAEGLAAGRMEEIWDIQLLIQAAQALQCFVGNETDQEAQLAMTEPAKADQPATETGETPATDVEKTETETAEVAATEQPAAPETPAEPATEAVKADDTDDVADAITKALKPLQDELTLVKGELAKVLETPQTGGPVRTRTTQQAATAAKADGLRTEIAHCQRLIPLTAGDVQKGYRMRLDTAEDELKKLDGATV